MKRISKNIFLGTFFPLCLGLTQCDNSSGFKGKNGSKKPAVNQSRDSNIHADSKSMTFTGAQLTGYEVDIIFLLDTSSSMDDKITRTIQNIQPLMSTFLNNAKNLNYKLYIVGDRPMGFQSPKISLVVQHVGSHSALAQAQALIAGAGIAGVKTRPNAVKEIVVVSDDDSDVSASDFLTWLDQNKPKTDSVHVSGIVTTGSKCGGMLGIGGGGRGNQYIQLAQNQRTRGVMGNICESNWNSIFQNIGKQLTEFKKAPEVKLVLQEQVINPGSIQVSINQRSLSQTDFSFDANTNSVLIKKETSPNDKIKISYY